MIGFTSDTKVFCACYSMFCRTHLRALSCWSLESTRAAHCFKHTPCIVCLHPWISSCLRLRPMCQPACEPLGLPCGLDRYQFTAAAPRNFITLWLVYQQQRLIISFTTYSNMLIPLIYSRRIYTHAASLSLCTIPPLQP